MIQHTERRAAVDALRALLPARRQIAALGAEGEGGVEQHGVALGAADLAGAGCRGNGRVFLGRAALQVVERGAGEAQFQRVELIGAYVAFVQMADPVGAGECSVRPAPPAPWTT